MMMMMGSSLSPMWRRKQQQQRTPRRGSSQLAKHLRVTDLISIGIGSTIGAGVYVLVGTVARERAGPAVTISFMIAGIAAALAALCYAELSSRCPSAGSAYHYAYLCVGEGVAWMVGWGLVLEYTIGGSTVARGIAPNLGVFVGGQENLPALLVRRTIPGIDVVVDPCAALLVMLVTGLLCVGIHESARVQSVMVCMNVLVLLFVAAVGLWAGFAHGWKGYEQSEGYLPYGINGVLGGAATLFFAYIGFDTVASTAEEVRNPQRDLPLGIGLALSICCGLYILVSGVIVGLIPYHLMDPDTPMSSAFADNNMPWAMYIVAAGAVAALATTLMGALLPQPRILMAMARDGLLPPFFCTIHPKSFVPVNGTILTGCSATLMALILDVDQLSGLAMCMGRVFTVDMIKLIWLSFVRESAVYTMGLAIGLPRVSVGTLLAFTIVAVCLLILRYVPPSEVSEVLQSLPGSSTAMEEYGSSSGSTGPILHKDIIDTIEEELQMPDSPPSATSGLSQNRMLLQEQANLAESRREETRRWTAVLGICGACIGVVLVSLATAAEKLPMPLRWILGTVGLPIFMSASTILFLIEQDEGRHKFGQSGGFHCPWVPALPIASILVNVYLLVNLGLPTWMRVSVWMFLGVVVYLCYGMRHSQLAKPEQILYSKFEGE